MRKLLLNLALSTTLASVTATHAMSDEIERVEAGVLNCVVKGGTGFVFGSTKDLSCTFDPVGDERANETYFGAISKFGLDIGATGQGVITWAVLAPTEDVREPGALAGAYRGVSAEASVGAGVGANALLGGSSETIVLQPISVTAQTGVNFALAVSQIELRTAVD